MVQKIKHKQLINSLLNKKSQFLECLKKQPPNGNKKVKSKDLIVSLFSKNMLKKRKKSKKK
jgi:hypothetical protein